MTNSQARNFMRKSVQKLFEISNPVHGAFFRPFTLIWVHSLRICTHLQANCEHYATDVWETKEEANACWLTHQLNALAAHSPSSWVIHWDIGSWWSQRQGTSNLDPFVVRILARWSSVGILPGELAKQDGWVMVNALHAFFLHITARRQ